MKSIHTNCIYMVMEECNQISMVKQECDQIVASSPGSPSARMLCELWPLNPCKNKLREGLGCDVILKMLIMSWIMHAWAITNHNFVFRTYAHIRANKSWGEACDGTSELTARCGLFLPSHQPWLRESVEIFRACACKSLSLSATSPKAWEWG